MKDVQQQGGPFEQQNEFIGLERQLTIDTTNDRILLHDGVTPGGRIFVPRDEGDARWMPIIEELLGWDDFLPNLKGMAMRSSPGVWAIRQIVGTDGNITIADGNGVAGNPTVSIPTNVTTNHVWSGTHEFETVIQGVGFIGDTQGDHTGNVVGDVTGDLTGNVTGNLEGDSVGTHVGPIDLRGADAPSFQSDEEVIPQSAIVGLVDAVASIPPALPTGVITMWYGNPGNVPGGWFLCNGDNGTPDLRDRFIVGAGGAYDSHEVGGAADFTPGGTIVADGEHAHTGTVEGHVLSEAEMPSHFHLNGVTDENAAEVFNHGATAANPTTPDSIDNNASTGSWEGHTTSSGSDEAHTHGLAIDEAGNHTHEFEGIATENLPPYYALCYIMKG